MPRAAPNTTADVYRGPDGVPPFAFRFTLTGRLVRITRLLSQSPSTIQHTAYFHWSGLAVTTGNAPVVAGGVAWNIDAGDQMEIPPGSGAWFQVLTTEIVRPKRGVLTPYRRAWLSG